MLRSSRSLVVTALLFVSAVCASGEAWAATITWTGTAGDGLWHTAGNWDLARIPAPADDVVIPNLPGTVSVTHAANVTDAVNSLACAELFLMPTGRLTLAAPSSFSSGLVLSNAVIDGAGNVTISGPGFDWQTGSFEGAGTLTISSGVTWAMSGINLSSFPGLQRPLDNFGTLQITNNRGMSVGGNGVFRNRSGGAVQWLNDGLIQCNGGFENQAGATFTRSAGAGLAQLQGGTFTNSGTLAVQSGTLEFSFITTSHSGSVTCPPGAVLSFGGTNATFSAGSSLAAAGTMAFSSFSNVTLDPAMAALTLNAVSMPAGGSLSVGPNVSIGSLTLTNGTLTGAGNVTVTNAFAWGDGTISGSGTMTIPAGLSWTSTGSSRLERSLVHLGNGVVAGSLRVNDPGVFQNQGSATLDLRSDGNIDGNGSLINASGATVLRTTGTGDLSYRLNTTNTGLFSVQSGSLLLSNSVLTQNGTLTTSPGASLRVNGTLNAGSGSTSTFNGPFSQESGSATFPASVASLSFAGHVSLSQGTLSIGPNLSIASLNQSTNGTLTGDGHVTLTNNFVWSGGTMLGAGITTVAPGVTWTIPVDPFNASPILARVLQNDGSCVYTSNNGMRIDAGGVFRNRSGGVVDVRPANAGFNNSGTFENQAGATFIRSTGAGTFAVQSAFSNAGTVRALTGTLDLNGPVPNLSGSTLTGGNWEVASTLRFNAAGLVTNAAAIVMDGAAAAIRSVNTNADLLAGFTNNAAAGSFTLKNGATRSVNLGFANAGAVVIGPGASTFTATAGYTQSGGSTTLVGGTLASTAGVQLNGGMLAGTGTVQGSLTNAATVSPGASPSAISVTGNYTQTAAGTLAVELAGTTSGSEYDVLAVGGAAQLNGALQASVLAPFVPAFGDSFSILTAASRIGAFASDNLPQVIGESGCLDAFLRPDAVRLLTLEGAAVLTPPAAQNACPGDSVALTVVVGGGAPVLQWRHDGVPIPGATSPTLVFDPVSAADFGHYDVVVSNACSAVTSASALLFVGDPPVFQQGPVAQVACAGDSATFTAVAAGLPAPTLQWRLDGSPIAGANSATLTLLASLANAGSIDVVATNSCGSVSTTPVTFEVRVPPGIVTAARDTAVCAQEFLALTIAVSGSPAPQVDWTHNGSEYASGTTLTIPTADTTGSGVYVAHVYNVCGVADDTVLVTVNAPPSLVQIIEAPNVQKCEGSPLTLTAFTPGASPAPSLQWRKGGVPISGATAAVFQIAAVTPADAGAYDLVASGPCGAFTSLAANVTVTPGTLISQQPQSVVACENGSATFSVTTSGGSPTFQWRRNTVDIHGATSITLVVNPVTAITAGTYDVVVTASCGAITSASATLAIGHCPDTLYVDAAAAPGGNGLAWGSAFQRLEDAISVSGAGGYFEIWVARGRYLRPASAPWLLRPKNELYGGLAPGATQRETRDLIANETVLTGDVLNNDGPNFTNRSDNRGQLVTSTVHDSTSVLDGFTLSGGNGSNGGAVELSGPGNGRIAHCVFTRNSASFGGAVRVLTDAITFDDCAFVENRALFNGGALLGGGFLTGCRFDRNRAGAFGVGTGGAIHLAGGGRYADCVFRGNVAALMQPSGTPVPLGGAVFVASPSVFGVAFLRCEFDSNGASAYAALTSRGGGGAVAVSNTSGNLVSFDDCTFFRNSVSGSDSLTGGAMFLTSGARVTATNCRFVGNTADSAGSSNGGALSNSSTSSVNVVQCLFERNSATGFGGAIHARSSTVLLGFTLRSTTISNNSSGKPLAGGVEIDNRSGPVTLVNSILFGNTNSLTPANPELAQLHVVNSPAPAVSFCSIQGLTGGFGGAGNVNGAPEFVDPAGPDLVAGTLDDDFRLQKKSQCVDRGDNGAVLASQPIDLGGDPRRMDDPCKADAGAGSAPIVDLGAYEFQGTSCVVAAAGDDGTPPAFAVHPPYPNPSRGGASLAFELPRAGRVIAEVFDLAGRRVSVMADREFTAGSHVLHLDGAGVEGRRLGAGFYTLRVRAAGQSVTKPLVIAK